MKYFCLSILFIFFISCVSAPRTGNEENKNKETLKTAKITFYNYSREEVYLRLVNRENVERNIGAINRDENGKLNPVDSLIPAGGNRDYIIEAGRYTIVLKKDQRGQFDTDFNEFEPFDFPPSKEGYTIHLFPAHERKTTARITSANIQNSSSNTLTPSFDIFFSDDMIRPIVEENIEINGENRNNVNLEMEWRNNRWLTIRLKEDLHASARYRIRLSVGARNTEGNRIKEAVEIPFTTGNLIEDISSFNLKTLRFDNSVPGYIRIDWELPFDADGAEIRMQGTLRDEDLQTKTNYTFSLEDGYLTGFRIIPYKISANGRKMYNQTDLNYPLIRIPSIISLGITVKHTIVNNTAYRLAVNFTFYADGKETKINNLELKLKNNITDRDLFILKNENNFKYSTNPVTNINWKEPNEDVTYFLLTNEDIVIYSFTVKSPSRAEIQAAADQRLAQEKQRAAQAERNSKRWERQQKLDEIINDERRFWSFGINTGSLYFGPALLGLAGEVGLIVIFEDLSGILLGIVPLTAGLIPLGLGIIYDNLYTPIISGNIYTTLAPFPYTFFELGCDALFFNPNGIDGDDYFSLYPYINFCGFIGTDGFEKGGFFFGAGVGRMFTLTGSAERRESYTNLIHDGFALNAIIGGKIGKNPHYFDVRAVGSFDFNNGFYFTMLCGYSFRFNR